MLPNRFVHIVELVKTRRARAAKHKRSKGQQVLQWSFYASGLVSVLTAVLALVALPYYLVITVALPPAKELESLLNPVTGQLLQPTKLYDHSGETLLLTLAPAGIERKFVEANDVPWLAKAYVASNQPDFWTASISGMNEWISSQRTIAERLVARVLLHSGSETWGNNLRVHLLAADVLNQYTHEQILTWALNSTDFGHWAFGVESASQLYFGKPASQLTLAESALLAAVAQAPALNPIDNPELAIRFQRLILTSMREQRLISQSELEQAIAEPLIFAQVAEPQPQSATTDFTNLVIEQLESELGHEQVIRGSLLVTTTMDYSLQQELSDLLGPDSETVGGLILDALNDRILAVSGEAKHRHDPSDTLSPFSYLSAFANGHSPSSLVWDISGNGKHDGVGPATMRIALANHLENVESGFLSDPSIEGIRDKLLHALGIESENEPGINLIEAGRAFEIFPQNGLFPITDTSKTLLFVSDQSGKVILDWTRTDWQSIVSPETAYLVTDVLSDKTALVSNLITDRPAAFFGDPESLWWFAFSPQRIVAIWDGENALQPETKLAILTAAHRGLPIKSWVVPSGLNSVIVCVPSGQLPDEDCPETRREWFQRGNEPREPDTLFSRVAINSANGKLATVFTPEVFIQERVYLSVPPAAEFWARQAGIPLSPRDYDPIPKVPTNTSVSSITRPEPFTVVNGLVRIFGTLSPDAVKYDIQVGEGLYPSEWIRLSESSVTQHSGRLAEWNTEGLQGIWAIQLQAWDAKGNLNRAYTVVTLNPNK